MLRQEFINHLSNQLIPFWNKLKDEKHGGFYGYVDSNGNIFSKKEKGCILNSRILWFYSSAYILLKDEALLDMAKHAYCFLTDKCCDSEYGGVYWSLHYDGTVADCTKHTYNQAFAIYALSAYYKASQDKEALNLAYSLYHTVESRCCDPSGYLEAFHRDFTPAANDKLSENGVIAERTMNTLLHVMEAYTELFDADTSCEVGTSLRRTLDLFRIRIFDREKEKCRVFFDKNYQELADLESYGHDIEASWLISRACEVLHDNEYTKNMQPIILSLVSKTYKRAFDPEQHALYNECENDIVDMQKIWWVQAEGVTGFFNAYQQSPHREEYLQSAQKIWHFIQTAMIDSKSGEWLESVGPNNAAIGPQALVHPWKCPYHNGRMCIEMIHRMEVSR